MEVLKINPSPKVGYILKKISEAQAEGKVTNRKAALELAYKLNAGGDGS